MSTPANPLVQMFSPDGQLGDIPYEKMHDALQAGAKMAVHIKAPDGSLGYVPADRVVDATKAGGTIIPYDLSGKQYAPGREFGMDVATGLGLDANKIASAEDTGGEGAAWKELGSEALSGIYQGAKSVLKDPFTLVNAPASNLESSILSRKPGQMLGAAAGIVGGAEGAERAPGVASDAASAAKTATANALRDAETGKLRTPVNLLARGTGAAVGGAVGHATGIPEAGLAGALTGAPLGSKIADWLIPDRDIPEPESSAAIKGPSVPIRNSPYFDSDAYNNGRSLLSRPQAAPTMPQGNPTPFGSNSGSTPASNGSIIIDPNSPAPPLNRTLQSYPREVLVSMARNGNVGALRELLRNPGGIDVQAAVPNARYLLDSSR